MESCEIDLDKAAVSFYLKTVDDKIVVSYHYAGENDYVKCVEIKYPKLAFKSFYVNMLARSFVDTNVRYEVSSMTLSTNSENIGISEFESKFDETIPKLFKEISFYKKNTDAMRTNMVKVDPQSLDISAIHGNQSQVFDMIDYSNTQLSRSIEETSSILSFIESQNSSTNEMGQNLIFSLNRWLEDSQKQYEAMDKDVGRMIAEMEAMNFDTIFETTDKLISDINKRFEQTSSDFKELRKFSKIIKKNLGTLHNKADQIHTISRKISRMGRRTAYRGTGWYKKFMTLLLLALGFVVIAALLAILYKLSAKKRSNILD